MPGTEIVPSPDRDSRGYFLPGNRLAKGNPVARRMHAYRTEILDALADGDVQAIIKKMTDLAKTGDTIAAKIVLEYAAGKPTQSVDHTVSRDDRQIDLHALVSLLERWASALPEERRREFVDELSALRPCD